MPDLPVRFWQFASRFSTPLSIAGLSITALYGLYRVVLEGDALGPLREGEAFVILDKAVTYLFVLSLAGLILGVGAHVATRIGPRVGGGRRPRRRTAAESNSPYEYLRWESTWDIKDGGGERVEHSKRLSIRFLQRNAGIITDRIWGNGEVMRDYRCSFGTPSDVFDYGDSKKVVISLRGNRKKGSVANFTISRTILKGFTRDEEWIEEDPVYPVRDYVLRVVFPMERPCRRAVLTRQRANVTEEVAKEAFGVTSDGRQELVVSVKDLGRDRVLLRWWW